MLHKGGARKYYKSLFSKQSSFHFRKVLSHLGNSWSRILSYWLWSLNLGNSCSPSMVYGHLLYKEGGSAKLQDNNNHSPNNSTTLNHLILSIFLPSLIHHPIPSSLKGLVRNFIPSSIVHQNFQPSTINSMASTSIDRVFVLCSMSG